MKETELVNKFYDKPWFIHIQAEAEEYIRMLHDNELYHKGIEKLEEFPFNDLRDQISVANNLLHIISTTGRGLSIFRTCIYAIVRRNIRKLRSGEVEKLIDEIENVIDELQDITVIFELELCGSILKLISDDPAIVSKLNKYLYEDVTKKSSVKMVNQILQAYKEMKIFWKKQWFPECMKTEAFFENVLHKEVGLNQFKKYIFNKYRDDSHIIWLALSRITEIINSNISEDIRDSAYWEGMSGGKSMKLIQFADPTPILNPNGLYLPILSPTERYAAVKILRTLIYNQDQDIANNTKSILSKYQEKEKSKHILSLYDNKNTEKFESKSKKQNIPYPSSLKLEDHVEGFNDWRRKYHISYISIDSCNCNSNGEHECTFSARIGSDAIKLKTTQRKTHIDIAITNETLEKYESLIREVNSSSHFNAFARMQDSMDGIIHKNFITKRDSEIIVDFFENLLVGKTPCTESIVLSAVYFLSLFSFANNKGQWGITTSREFYEIMELKLCMSYVYQIYGKQALEEIYHKHTESALLERKLIPIPRKFSHFAKKKSQIQLLSEFYNIIKSSENNFKCPVVSGVYSEVLYDLEKFSRPKTVLYECSLAFQKILRHNIKKSHFSINRTSIYLKKLQEEFRDSKYRIIDLEHFIHTIINCTDINFGNDKSESFLNMIQSFNVLMSYLYTVTDLNHRRQEIVNHSLKKMIDIATHFALKVPKEVDLKTIQTYCDLYIIVCHRKNEWIEFREIISRIIQSINFNARFMLFDIINCLTNSIKKYFILHKLHSQVLIEQLDYVFAKLKEQYHSQNRMLLSSVIKIFPVSPILWSINRLNKYFFDIASRVISYYGKYNPKNKLIKVIELLHAVIQIEKSIVVIEHMPKARELKKELGFIHERAAIDLIEIYIMPSWMKWKEDSTSKQTEIIMHELRLSIKEDPVFLKKLEEYYQKFLFHNGKNPWHLNDIFIDIKKRFDHEPLCMKLKPTAIRTYKKDGSVFEVRKGYNILEFIFNERCKVPFLKVSNDGHVFLSALTTPINIGNTFYFAGFGGGGKMKVRLNFHGLPENSLLPILSERDFINGKIGKSLEFLRSEEFYYYWQRMFNPYSPDGSVVTGRFNIMFADDGTVSFGAIKNADGCGFIREGSVELLSKEIAERTPYSIRRPIQTYQSMHYNKRGLYSNSFEQAINECTDNAIKEVNKYIAANQKDQASVKELYSIITTGCALPGRNFVAIPAVGNDRFIVPLHLRNSDLLFGKTPVETPFHIMAKQENEIFHLKSNERERREIANSVNSTFGFQYSFIGVHEDSVVFIKGVLVIIPDRLWNYKGVDIICCSQDKKVDSKWAHAKIKPKHGLIRTYNGVLTPIQKYGPGSFIAISEDIQMNKWSSDYDGDIITISMLIKGTNLFSIIKQNSEFYSLYNTPKIPKTFTKPICCGEFKFFRFEQIIQARTANLLTKYSRLSDVFIGLKDEYQQKIACTIAVIPQIVNLVKNILVNDEEDKIREMLVRQPVLVVQKILSAGIKTGSDAFKSKVNWVYFGEFQKVMSDIFIKMDIPNELIYFKHLSINMHTTMTNLSRLSLEVEYQRRLVDSLPLVVLHETLKLLPQHKQKQASYLLAKQLSMDDAAKEAIQASQKEKFENQKRKIARKYNHRYLSNLGVKTIEPEKATMVVASAKPFLHSDVVEKTIPDVVEKDARPIKNTHCFDVDKFLQEADMAVKKREATEIAKQESVKAARQDAVDIAKQKVNKFTMQNENVKNDMQISRETEMSRGLDNPISYRINNGNGSSNVSVISFTLRIVKPIVKPNKKSLLRLKI